MTSSRKEITKIFGIKQPVSSQPFIKGDEWHHPDEGLRIFNGTAWVMACKGKNCKSIDGKDHSAECIAEHEATVDAGKTDKKPNDKPLENEELDENQAAAEKAQRDAEVQRQLNDSQKSGSTPSMESTKKGGAPAPSHKKGGAK